jgi:seryl-tRNA synthetase
MGEIERQLLSTGTRWFVMAAGTAKSPLENTETKTMKQRAKLEQKIRDLENERTELGKKIGLMSRTPRYDSEYSGAKLNNWQMDQARLTEKIDNLREELNAHVVSPGYLKQVEKRTAEMVAKRDALSAKLTEMDKKRKLLEYSAITEVFNGADALEVAADIRDLEESIKTTGKALHFQNKALSHLTKSVPAVVDPPVEWVDRIPTVEAPLGY